MYLNIWLLLQVLLVITILINETASFDHFCSNTTSFDNNSTFQSNLNTLFRSLSSNSTNNPYGFYQTTAGDPKSETIYGQYLCRGDMNISECNECVTTATTTDLPTACPNKKVAIIYYDDCTVRYSNDSFFNTREQSPSIRYHNTNPIIGNATRFMETITDMISNVIAVKASVGGPFKKFATAFVNNTIFQTAYVLGQCTPDLRINDCYICMNSSIAGFQPAPGGQLRTPSCIVRFENYPFFNLSYLPSPSPSPSPAPKSSPAIDHSPVIMPPSSKGKKKVTTQVIVSVIASVVVFLVAMYSLCILLLKKKAKKVDAMTNAQISDQDFTAESLQYDFERLLVATNNFSDENKLGEGGFGGVYKGTLPNGHLIAVKRLSASSSQGIQEFKTEALLVAKLQHRNLVRLLGFCYTGQEKVLVYEHVANKSLDNFIFDNEKRRQLDWQKRYNIIKGIARGLLYLHHDSQLLIIHRDLKASNILLDAEMNPKISDFGTSRIFGVDQTQNAYTNKVVGTYGYMAPEYALQGQFSIKSDVYSFGVIVLEIISGRRNNSFTNPNNADDLRNYAWKQWKAGTPLEFVDSMIRDSCSNNTEVMRCLHLGLLCVQESAEDRPTMANVVLTLESYTITLPIPEQPDLFARIRVKSSKEDGSDHSSAGKSALSVNEVSITEPEPR